jgi:uncharacterized membrane protein YheB (UPF0754 family)
MSFFNKGDEMIIFKDEPETKRMIFNIRGDLADRLLLSKEEARSLGKRLDIETTINKAIEKFLQKAEKRIKEEKKKHGAFLQTLEKKAADSVLSDSKDVVESVVTEEDPR